MMELREIRFEGVDRDQWWALLKKVVNSEVQKKAGNFLIR
jgi:hypothetical protein